jgi:hypothetical protein
LNEGGNDGKYSLETRQKLSIMRRGKKNSMYGKKHTIKAINKMRQSKLGKNNPRYGIKVSLETRRKLSELNKGKNNPMYGKKPSLNHRRKISESLRGNGLFGTNGAYLDKRKNPERKCWQSYIKYGGKNRFLGLYNDPLSAQMMYELVRDEIYGVDLNE